MQNNDKKALVFLRPLLVKAVAGALHSVFGEQRHADKVIEYTLRLNPKAGSSDRAFIAENTYEVVRHYRLYTEILGHPPQKEGDYWALVGIHLALQGQDLPDWKEFADLDAEKIKAKTADLSKDTRFRNSIPDWLDTLGRQELGDQWEATIDYLNRPAKVVLRTNLLRGTRADLLKKLADEGIEASPVGHGDALVLEKRKNVFQTKAFKTGLFEVQDYSSQLVAPFLAPEPGMRVVDACAGGGGKTLHLAALMQSKGQLIALDIHNWKLEELRLRARRAGASNIEARPIENNKVIKRLFNSADRLLLDVPCSGLGVLRRNPDSKWKLSEESIEKLRQTQAEILRNYSPILRSGGQMVYATCSILPSENEKQVEAFLNSQEGKDFTLVNEKKILPQDDGFDGFYMALLKKK